MGAPARIPIPAAQMTHLLWEARMAGDIFEHAWVEAWKRIQWPHDTEHRRQWKKALTWARDEYLAAWNGSPSIVTASVYGMERTAA